MEERVAEGRERRRFEVQGLEARIVTRGILSPTGTMQLKCSFNHRWTPISTDRKIIQGSKISPPSSDPLST